jgi:hypothetical protein
MTSLDQKELINQEFQRALQKSQGILKEAKSIALQEAWKVLQLVVATVVQIIEDVARELSGPDKKALALDIVEKFYDTTFIVVDIPFLPNFIEPILHKHIKKILLTLVSGSIDATVTTFRTVGVFRPKLNLNLNEEIS